MMHTHALICQLLYFDNFSHLYSVLLLFFQYILYCTHNLIFNILLYCPALSSCCPSLLMPLPFSILSCVHLHVLCYLYIPAKICSVHRGMCIKIALIPYIWYRGYKNGDLFALLSVCFSMLLL